MGTRLKTISFVYASGWSLIFGCFFVKLGKWLAPLSRTDHYLLAAVYAVCAS